MFKRCGYRYKEYPPFWRTRCLVLITILCSLIVFVSGCSGQESSSHNVTLVDGYTPAATPELITLPEFFSTSDPNDERFSELGAALKRWHYGVYTVPEALSEEHSKHRLSLTLFIGNAVKRCADMGIEVNNGCAVFSLGPVTHCDIYIDEDSPDRAWGHELWHCVEGRFHP